MALGMLRVCYVSWLQLQKLFFRKNFVSDGVRSLFPNLKFCFYNTIKFWRMGSISRIWNLSELIFMELEFLSSSLRKEVVKLNCVFYSVSVGGGRRYCFFSFYVINNGTVLGFSAEMIRSVIPGHFTM
jgi:hypothetical protein